MNQTGRETGVRCYTVGLSQRHLRQNYHITELSTAVLYEFAREVTDETTSSMQASYLRHRQKSLFPPDATTPSMRMGDLLV